MVMIAKIKKLLALGKSPNANEAATAILKAQELMERYGVDINTVETSEIVEEELNRHVGKKPSAYEAYLMSSIARAFGCRLIHRIEYEGAKWVFIGTSSRSEVAAFISTVLLRKLSGSRRAYMKTLYRCKRDTKIRRADDYCLGWVASVIQKIKTFSGSDDDETILDLYMKRYDTANKLETINRKASNNRYQSFYLGQAAAQNVEIQHGVTKGYESQELLTSELG
ncbi:MAG TPA: DUF2786 domain-containing protein [Rectinemataceae bacterium]|nr:DUF2786 domain-containing protein [Rectinemataceae bacterium]